jgi:hypothetical protein
MLTRSIIRKCKIPAGANPRGFFIAAAVSRLPRLLAHLLARLVSPRCLTDARNYAVTRRRSLHRSGALRAAAVR